MFEDYEDSFKRLMLMLEDQKKLWDKYYKHSGEHALGPGMDYHLLIVIKHLLKEIERLDARITDLDCECIKRD